MRLGVVILCLSLTAFSRGQNQSPGEGRLEAGRYVNRYFNLSYTWPKTLHAVNPASLAIASKGSEGEYLLFVARKGNEPSGVVLIAERIEDKAGVLPRKASVIRDGPDFLNKVVAGWDAANPGKVEGRRHFAGTGGLTFDELDYRQAGELNSAIVAQIGQYLLAFRCNAKTEADLEEMKQSVFASQHALGKSGSDR